MKGFYPMFRWVSPFPSLTLSRWKSRLARVSSIRSVGFDEAGNAVLPAGLGHGLDRADLVFIDTFDAAPSRRCRRAAEFHDRFADVRGRTIAATADLGFALHGVLRWR